ncbi:MAG: response regulator, partial [Planctomycetota bacterium]|nr:response regulator [Planctomycetota bacterium]
VEDPDRLVTTNIWHLRKQNERAASDDFIRLRNATESLRFGRGEALPGQIWESGEPAWVVNLQEAGENARSELARKTGVKGAFGFPIKIRGETAAVLEFFSEKPMAPDRSLLAMVRSLGEQVGRVIERTRAESAVRQTEQELTELFEHAAVGLLFLSPDAMIQRANDVLLSTLGYAMHDFVGRSLREFLVEKSSIETLDECCRDGCALSNYETRLRAKDGSTRHVLLDANARIVEGKVAYLRCFARDITDRKRDESERARLAAIVQSSDDAIIGLSADGLVTSWNRGAERLYGYHADDVAGGSISVIVPPEREEEMTRLLETVKRGERVEQYETVRVHRDGRRIHVSMTASPIRSAPVGAKPGETTIVGVAMIERDISERRRVAAEIRRAVQEAERANRAKGEFLANVSHELRTPMNAIIGMTELSLDEPIPDRVRDYLETAKDSAEVLLRLLNDILDFSRIEAGRFELDEAKFSLRETLEETVKTLAMPAHEKALEIGLDLPHDAPDRLVGDPVRLRQVLSNLISNAIKFTESGEVVVHAEPQRVGERDAEFHFRVQDTGIGISPADQDRIFAPFAQVDATSTRNHGGAGLGLAICRELVEMMNGRLWVESQLGAGTTFHFTARFAMQGEARGAPPGPVKELKDLPVLVVDDSATNRRILEDTLRNWHMRPVMVRSAEEALAELQKAADSETTYPLVIVDGLMPGTDGFTLVERIKNDEQFAAATVLMLSSADRRLFRERCDGLNIAAYLEKPVTQSELLDTIVTALHGPPLEKEAADEAGRIGGAEHPLSVLLVEDTPANRKVVTAVLNKRGHTVTIAADGREAVDLFKQRRDFDMVLMDVQMPNMDGFQATGIIRTIEQSRGSRTPIVAMTAHAMRGDRERCLASGMDAYLSKPIDVRRMLRLIERIARRSRAALSRSGPNTRSLPPGSQSGDQAATNGDGVDLSSAAPQESAMSAPSILNAPQTAKRDPGNMPHDSPQDAGGPVFDKSSALERLGDDEQLFRELATYFQEDSATELSRIEEGIAKDDWPAVRIAAHSLKGLAANFSARSTTEAAREMEEAANEGDGERVKSLLDRVRNEVERLRDALLEEAG